MDPEDDGDIDYESWTWDYNIRASLGFHDHATEAADLLNHLLLSYIPIGISWQISNTQWIFELQGLTIYLQNSRGLAVVAKSDHLPRKILDSLRSSLRAILYAAISEAFWNTTAFGIMILQLVEEANICLDDFEKSILGPPKQKGWDAGTVTSWQRVVDNPSGVDLLTVNDTAQHLLGRPISDVCKDLPEGLRILHSEPVIRSDLVLRFLQRKSDLKAELQELTYNTLRKSITKKQITSGEVADSIDGIVEYLTTPKVTFHGAPRHVISSIVRYGFLLPGQQIGKTNAQTSMSNGACYGPGIYSSPSIEFASFYGRWSAGSGSALDFYNPSQIPGFRMIVCATIMGRSIAVNQKEARYNAGILKESAHSQVSPNGLEYVIFDKAQIIPCYVLHVDYGSDSARAYIDERMKDPNSIGKSRGKPRIELDSFEEDDDGPGARMARKDARKAAATKWFPYGYGPATGMRFTIEEIGDISDDEEDFGDFQAIRGEQEHEIQSLFQRQDENVSWFDEYQRARNTKEELYEET